MKYFVGIDQSYSSTGVVILGGPEPVVGAFRAGKPGHPFHERVHDLWKQISRVLPPPDECIICMEGAAFAAEFNTFMLGELSGALRYLMYINGYEYMLAQPTVVKKYATGSGNAQKSDMAIGVAKKWGYYNKCNDIIDAYAMAKIAEAGGPDKLVFEPKARKPRKVKS